MTRGEAPPSTVTAQGARDGARTAGVVGVRGAGGAALALLVPYTALQVYWQLGHRPAHLSPIGPDLIVFTGWAAVALCTVAALTLVAFRTLEVDGTRRWLLLVAGWVVGLALVVAGALLILDVVGGLLPELSIPVYPLGALSKAVCVGSGLVLVRTARAYQCVTRGACGACGRGGTSVEPSGRPSGWVHLAAWASVAGCLVRILAQAVVGFDRSPFDARDVLLFEAGFVLGGTVLPLALVRPWGRVWPRWVPGVAGRPVPRRLVLWPAAGISGGLVTYFGVVFVQMVFERVNGRNPFPPSGGLDLPEAFFWVAVPAYLLWGLGMGVAALDYAVRTRPPCRACGRS